MKKFFSIVILACLCVLPLRGSAVAHCSDDQKYGTVTLQAPTLPVPGNYTIWTRLQVPSASSNQYRLQINDDECFEVGGSSIEPGQWQWVSFQDGDLSHKVVYDFQKTTGNKLSLIGINPGVKIDRVLLVKSDCVPVGFGSNCESVATPVAAQASGASEIPPPSNGPVSGLVVVSPTITQNPGAIVKVSYFSDSVSMPTAKNFALDTTLLSNGTHRITMQIARTDGTVSNESTTLQVSNPENAFSPLRRWIRLNQGTATLVSSIIGGVFVIIATLLIVRHIKLNRRLLEFRGF